MLESILEIRKYIHKNSSNLKNQLYTNDTSYKKFHFVINKEDSYG